MKCVEKKEFQDRIEAVARARKIFTPHLTRNISLAFELYQEIFAEQERRRLLSTQTEGRMAPALLDDFVRPECPECGEPLYLRSVCGKGIKQHGNLRGWKTCWECLGPSCTHEEYSKKSVGEWVKKLRRKE